MRYPEEAACGTKVYDYFTTSLDISPAVYSVAVVNDTFFGLHSPVRLFLRAAPRAMTDKALAAPRGFEAVLPHGPATTETDIQDKATSSTASEGSVATLEVNHEYPRLIAGVEQQVSSIAGHEVRQTEAHSGRQNGAKIVS